MSSLFLHFRYYDGTIQPDPETGSSILVMDPSVFETPEVSVEGWCDLIYVTPEDFDMTSEDYAAAGLPDNVFCPSFISQAKEAIESDEDGVLIPLNPTELQIWATAWKDLILAIPEEELEGMFAYKYSTWSDAQHTGLLVEELTSLIEQAQCAQQHGVGMMLHITW